MPGDARAFELGNRRAVDDRRRRRRVDDLAAGRRYAAGLARRQGARIVAVYVGTLAPAAMSATGAAELATARLDDFHTLAEELRQRAQLAARELGISVSFIATRGDPFSELRRIADEVRADAIVVGASSKAGHRFVGSLAVRLVRASKWPVTVVP